MIRLLLALVWLAVSTFAPPVAACFQCEAYVCSPALGGGRTGCQLTCRGGVGDPAVDCFCVLYGHFCYGARGSAPLLATRFETVQSYGAMRPASPWASLVHANFPVRTERQDRGVVQRNDLPRGCTERQLPEGSRVVECGSPLPPATLKVSLSAVSGDLLQIAEVEKDIALLLVKLIRASRIDPIPLISMQTVVDQAWTVESVRAFILGGPGVELPPVSSRARYSIDPLQIDSRTVVLSISPLESSGRTVIARFVSQPGQPLDFVLSAWSLK